MKPGDESPLTDAQLRLGLRQLWRPGWPDDLATVLQDPVRGNLVRGMARQLSRASATAAPRRTSLPSAPVPATPSEAPRRLPMSGTKRPHFDARKAAANDLDD
jgi:hypothetical protein